MYQYNFILSLKKQLKISLKILYNINVIHSLGSKVIKDKEQGSTADEGR